VVALAYRTSHEGTIPAGKCFDSTGLRTAAVVLVAGIFGQLVLGAIMRHIDRGQAALAIPDFPLALGQVIPPLDSAPVAIHFAHRVGALVVLALVGNVVVRAFRSGDVRFTRPALGLVALVLVQVTLGAFTVWTAKAVYPTCAHVANGAAVLATALFLALRAFRVTSAPERTAAPSALPESA
jgi:cytochrome c oxidase assembly protein subunit 15